jgi:selenide,water dikinase
LKNKTAVDLSVPDDLIEIALDPQTSGGLLIALPSRHADGLVNKLRSIRVDAARIGYATTVQDVSVRLV